jgi:2-amino-4-hydroxy-6-hydroxymethyldihydropteridine diphosphokinase
MDADPGGAEIELSNPRSPKPAPLIQAMKRVYLSLGSNLGDRRRNIAMALEHLARQGVRAIRVSSYYRTEPVDYLAQPWFLNCVAEMETEWMPLQLLHRCQAVERALGRRPGTPKGPRIVDIDILLYGDSVIRSPGLRVPHDRLGERRFVLIPLAELAPSLREPVTQRTILELLRQTGDRSQVIKVKPEA